MTFKVSNYACNDMYTVETHTGNTGRIIDKLIRLAAKLTESFASDIYYDISALLNAIQIKQRYDVLLFFYESGVSTWVISELYDKVYESLNTIQIWRLTHDPATMETKLIRVNVKKEE